MSMHCANATTCIVLVVGLALNIFYFFCFKNLILLLSSNLVLIVNTSLNILYVIEIKICRNKIEIYRNIFFCNYSAENEYRKKEKNEQCQMLNLQ
jgi:hypothetical protein